MKKTTLYYAGATVVVGAVAYYLWSKRHAKSQEAAVLKSLPFAARSLPKSDARYDQSMSPGLDSLIDQFVEDPATGKTYVHMPDGWHPYSK